MLDGQLAILCLLSFVINLVGSLAYSVRIAGVRTRRIAVSLSLFNVLLLLSRTANSFQAPMLAKRVEENLFTGADRGGLADFRWLIAAASIATVVGALLTPTFQRIFTRAVASFSVHRSLSRLMLGALSPAGLSQLRETVAVPASDNLRRLPGRPALPLRILVINTVATAVWTVGVFASLYAAYLNPELRVTSSNLSAIVNGVATILLFAVVDPHLSILTDDVVEGRVGEPFFRRCVVWMLGTRLAGTVLAQLLLLPAAAVIASVAQKI